MDAYTLMRTLGSLAVVLGLLAGALWIVRRYDIRLPGRVSSGGGRRLEVVERTTLDSRRSIALLRRDGREHLILLTPEGNMMLEAGIIRDDIDHAAEAARLEAERQAAEISKAEAEALRQTFAAMVDKARDGVKTSIKAAEPVLEQIKSRIPAHINSSSPTSAPAASVAGSPAPTASSSKRPAKAAKPRKTAQSRPNRSRTASNRRG